MHFLPDVLVTCDRCGGKRYNKETLAVLYKGKNIADFLAMTVDEAFAYLRAHPLLKRKLATLRSVGLGYIRLGQPAPTLSGGEAQRIKLTKELGRKSTGRTLFLLDEPTTGLHFDDVRKLLELLSELVGRGNTVVVIEHNLDVIKYCDHVIDLGPEGGEEGGWIVAQGTPEEVAAAAGSHTGRFLKKALHKDGSAA
jgi:excinuclease ABC subunit A